MPGGPLTGTRVVEIGTMVTAPLAGVHLAELGAEVIKVEHPGRPEPIRAGGTVRHGIPAYFYNLNRGKRFCAIDAGTPEGREVLGDLVASADVLLHNLRPGKLDKLGVGYEAASARTPGLVVVSISGFGADGPWSALPCYDFVVQGLVGIIDYQRDPETGRADLVRTFLVDKATAYTAVQAVLAALVHRGRTGQGQHVQLNMLDAATAFFWPDSAAASHTYRGPVEGRSGDLGAGYRVYPTADGAVAMMPHVNEWAPLCRAIGLTELIDDPRFTTRDLRARNGQELLDAVGIAVAGMTTDELVERCAAEDVAMAPVRTRDDLLANPQAQWNGTVQEAEVEPVGPVRHPRPPWRFGASPAECTWRIGHLGADTRDVLASLGRTPADIDALVAAGAVAEAAAEAAAP
jgi:crotonobetainyl-CoA:carnitine CoA-transferase CaiB-like acyl-CoA transferase